MKSPHPFSFQKVAVACLSISLAFQLTPLLDFQMASASYAQVAEKSTFSLSKALMPTTAENSAKIWAECLKQRTGAFRYALLSSDLKKKEQKDYEDIYWVIGGSSPWVASYDVKALRTPNASTAQYEIHYILTDSTRMKYDAIETLDLKKEGAYWYVTSHPKDILFPDFTESKDAPFEEAVLKTDSALITSTPVGTATLWAESLKQRNGGLRFAALGYEQRKSEVATYIKSNWVLGGSSPWITNYTVKEVKKIDASHYQYQIDYTMTDSTKTRYTASEKITLESHGFNWIVVKHDAYKVYPPFKKKSS